VEWGGTQFYAILDQDGSIIWPALLARRMKVRDGLVLAMAASMIV
jgi:hypothetical protein